VRVDTSNGTDSRFIPLKCSEHTRLRSFRLGVSNSFIGRSWLVRNTTNARRMLSAYVERSEPEPQANRDQGVLAMLTTSADSAGWIENHAFPSASLTSCL